jgi:hypothetical protein
MEHKMKNAVGNPGEEASVPVGASRTGPVRSTLLPVVGKAVGVRAVAGAGLLVKAGQV